jgi:hypothetical protein
LLVRSMDIERSGDFGDLPSGALIKLAVLSFPNRLIPCLNGTKTLTPAMSICPTSQHCFLFPTQLERLI